MPNHLFTQNRLAHAVSLASVPLLGVHTGIAQAQIEVKAASKPVIEEVIVTSSRREQSIQDIPINIAAVSGEKITDLRLTGIAEISRYVPGLTVVDRGPRDEVPDLFVRGLNTTGLGPGYVTDTVATYLGDIPLQVDLKPVDLERVEVLIGPQGTLYGQGTMGGAIRYIPYRADANEFYAEVRGDISSMQESNDIATDFGATINLPIIADIFAIRANLDQLNDPGFIDYNYVVREAGVSNPQPDFDDPDDVAQNLRQVEDANGEDTLSARLNLRWTPNAWVDANLWYYYQDTEAEGRQLAHQLAFGTGPYESAMRFEEPNHYTNELISVELIMDLGFAEATIVYGDADYEELGQRDQTDLLLDFEYGYEAFPSFSAYTREEVAQNSKTAEARLVSQHSGPLQWVVGLFDNELKQDAVSEEYTPGYDQFAVDNLGGVQLRPDSLEYIQLTDVDQRESAFYGELSYDIADNVTATLGYRRYQFEVDNTGGYGLPLYFTVFDGAPPDSIDVELQSNDDENEGNLFKLNLSWDVDPDNMVYFTFSQGYRNGGVNLVPECTEEQINSGDQQLCAQEDEVLFESDTIDNYEFGYKGLLFDESLSITAAVFIIDWQDLQYATTTEFGSLPITDNASAAESKGLELQSTWLIAENWRADFSYGLINADLTEYAPGLVGPLDALPGARLPGHSEHRATLGITYSNTVFNNINLDVNYGIVYVSDVYNIIGGPEDPLLDPETVEPADFGGEAIPEYNLHHFAVTLSQDSWRLQAYIDNLWNEYYILGTRTTRRFLQDEQSGPGNSVNGFLLRSYGQYVGAPRKMGIRLSYQF